VKTSRPAAVADYLSSMHKLIDVAHKLILSGGDEYMLRAWQQALRKINIFIDEKYTNTMEGSMAKKKATKKTKATKKPACK
jgi:hypothetical protein